MPPPVPSKNEVTNNIININNGNTYTETNHRNCVCEEGIPYSSNSLVLSLITPETITSNVIFYYNFGICRFYLILNPMA